MNEKGISLVQLRQRKTRRRQEDGRTCKLGKTDQRYKILDSI